MGEEMFRLSEALIMNQRWLLGDLDIWDIGAGDESREEVALWIPGAGNPKYFLDPSHLPPATIIGFESGMFLGRVEIPSGELPQKVCLRREEGVALSCFGFNGGGAFAAKLHPFRPEIAHLPSLYSEYPARKASHGSLSYPSKSLSLDPLESLGVMILAGQGYALLGDVDGHPRGWEKIPSWPPQISKRSASTTQPLMLTDRIPRAFDKPDFSELAKAIQNQIHRDREVLA